MLNNDNEGQPVRILDLLLDDKLRGTRVPAEMKTLPIYTIVEDGILKVNMGIRRDSEELIAYDVTNASETLRQAYSDSIIEFRARTIIDERRQVARPHGQIKTMLSLLGEYRNLSIPERNQVGHNYVLLTSLDGGIDIKPILTAKDGLPGNTYLEINPDQLSDELTAKLASDMTELVEMENGLYEQKDVLAQSKEL